jgi:hypothetical protein
VIDVRPPRLSARVSIARLLVPSAIAALASLAACRGSDAPAATARAEPSAVRDTNGLTLPAEVVIARPSGRYQADSIVGGGSITGTVTTSAPLQVGAPIPTGRDSALCGPSIPDESVSQQGNALGGAVVWLDGIRRGKPLPIERRLELESDHCKLTPRVQGGVVGSAVNVIGHDDFRQHLHFMAGGEREPRATVLLDLDEQVIPTERPFSAPGLVVVRDADHKWPTAYLAVFDDPYFAVTAPNGTFTIDAVPPGRYTVKVWHERTTVAAQVVDVAAGGSARLTLVVKGK